MSESENIGSFLKENKKLVNDYFETRLEIYRLQAIRFFARFAGTFTWIIILLLLLFVLVIFGGIVLSLWFSKLAGSYVAGFGITTIIFFVILIVMAMVRRALFINPIIKAMIKLTNTESVQKEKDNNL